MKGLRPKKSESILVRISPDDKALIEDAARNIGVSTSSFIVHASKRHAEAMLSNTTDSIDMDHIASKLNSDSTKRLDEIIFILKGMDVIGGLKNDNPKLSKL